MQIEILNSLFNTHKETQLFHRYIHTKTIEPLLKKLPSIFKVEVIGKSVNNENIFSITFGNGKKKILMWSQMHGNESTTTKAIFDLINTLSMSNSPIRHVLENCTIKIIPILNPDGALVYTRLNANEVDLNRDAQNLSQPESKVLKSVFDVFKPDFCFNLHGQRTIYSVGHTNYPATISFLSPAQDPMCTVTKSRKISMEIISEMNKVLQNQIPNQVALYDDAFNINCVGDTFQSHNVPTILFEAGHYNNDYAREESRKYIFQSLLTSLDYISQNEIDGSCYRSYLKIPKNETYFFDIIIRNARVNSKNKNQFVDIGILYEERLKEDKIEFIPKVEKISDLSAYYGHKEINSNGATVSLLDLTELEVGSEIDCVLINNMNFSLKPENT